VAHLAAPDPDPRLPAKANGRRKNIPENKPKEPRSVVLLLHCPLRLGLAASLTQFIYAHK
jgi:hypothetical protein